MLQRVLRTSMPDDVSFFRSRFDVYSGASPRPGVRVYAQGAVLGEGADLVVDVVFDLALHPRPAWVSMEGFRVRAVSSSTIVATKLRVVAELDRGWRPKDLSDALLLLRARPPADLGAAIEHAWAQTDVAPREILVRPSWWSPGRARWDAWRTRSASTRAPGRADQRATRGTSGARRAW